MFDHRVGDARPAGKQLSGDARLGRLDEADILDLVGEQRIAMLGDFDDDHALAGHDGHRRKADDDMRVAERENAAAQREHPRSMLRRAGNLPRPPDGADRMSSAAPTPTPPDGSAP